MSLDSSNELQKQFEQFWKFAEADSNPLLRVRPNWEYWFHAKLKTRQRGEIKQIVAGMSETEQEIWVKWVEDWISQRFNRRGAGRLVLVQLAQLPLFESWACLKPYRFENLKGINAIVLQSEGKGKHYDVTPLIVLLIPKNSSDSNFESFNMNMTPVADEAVAKCRNAALSLLRGSGLLLLLALGEMLGKKPRRWWLLNGIGWTVVASTLSFLLISPAAFMVDALLAPMLLTLFLVTGLLVFYGFRNHFREVRLAWKWARLLRQSKLCLLAGGAHTANFIGVDGPSFGVELCLSILLALQEECPVTAEKSWLWWQISERLVKIPSNWDGTGELTDRGWVKPVGRMEHKIEASCEHPDITDMITPVQKEVPGDVVQCPPNTVMRRLPCFGEAEGISELRLHRCYHMAHVLLVIGGLVNAFAAPIKLIMVVLLAVMVAALPDICWILHPPPNPEWVFEKCGFGNIPEPGCSGDCLFLYFKTDHPKHFVVYFDSPYWANREKQLDRTNDGYAVIRLVKLDNPQGSPYDGEIRLKCDRKFLFRSLPPVTIDEIILWHCLKKGWEARGTG